MDKNIGLSEMKTELDAQRRRFAEIALDIGIDEPTRHFAHRALEAFEQLGLQLRSLEYAHQNATPRE